MDLTTAVRIVIADTREQNGGDLTAREAVESTRSTTMDDVNGSRSPGEDPRLLPAYTAVLAATDAEIESALRSLVCECANGHGGGACESDIDTALTLSAGGPFIRQCRPCHAAHH